MDIRVVSAVFKDGETIPAKYGWGKENISPSISWSSVPAGAKSIAMICDDPDAPRGTWVHWVIYNIPADVSGLNEGVPHGDSLPDGSMQGTNDFPGTGYDGPWPPSGVHRYYFKIYALDSKLDLKPGVKKSDLEAAMKGHILAQGQLMGRYKR